MILPPASTIGIVGGGQLGRMLVMAAAHMGYKTHVLCEDENSPASVVSTFTTVASYTDEAALRRFAEYVDVVTFEFENIPPTSLELLQATTTVHPSPTVLAICRHRVREKSMIRDCGIMTAPFIGVKSLNELKHAVEMMGTPCVLKTCEFGYDGKGQIKIESESECETAWNTLGSNDTILEGWMKFEREISVIVARDLAGNMRCYDPVENIHRNHILAQTNVPAIMPDEMAKNACNIATKLAEKLDLVGIMAVELFVMKDGSLLVNELAPRPHNSGHWTIEAAATSQFEQHIRAICGYALGDTTTLSPCTMLNLIGDEVLGWETYAKNPKAHLHIYGKAEIRAGRKMGHVTVLE